tara:strand:+ start:223 stop:402 length:180 start_codon:yes stop_codon:yes gene_type:complete
MVSSIFFYLFPFNETGFKGMKVAYKNRKMISKIYAKKSTPGYILTKKIPKKNNIEHIIK